MNGHQHPELTVTPTTGHSLQLGDQYITMNHFLQLLQLNQIRIARATLYRWMQFPKHFLPRQVQSLLAPAPTEWFTRVPTDRPGSSTKHLYVIPLTYISEPHRQNIVGALSYQEHPSSSLVSVRAIRTQLKHLQHQVQVLEGLLLLLDPGLMAIEDSKRPSAQTERERVGLTVER